MYCVLEGCHKSVDCPNNFDRFFQITRKAPIGIKSNAVVDERPIGKDISTAE